MASLSAGRSARMLMVAIGKIAPVNSSAHRIRFLVLTYGDCETASASFAADHLRDLSPNPPGTDSAPSSTGHGPIVEVGLRVGLELELNMFYFTL
jgi:hypothetical protein